jgi:RimJ/RimL family protein N-acetyltransferase
MSDPLDTVDWPKLTERLAIRRATPGDLDATWRYRSHEDVARWITLAPATREKHTEWFADPDQERKRLVVELDGEVIGDLMVDIGDAWAQAEVADQALGMEAELGWTLDPALGGRGYATEAVAELLRICFEELGLRRVIGLCFADNESSWRLMERLGMRRETHAVQDSLHRDGGWLDGYGYALLADEWRETSVTRDVR